MALDIHNVSEAECDICNEILGKECRFHKQYDGVLENRLISRTANFSLIPSIGQIISGYCLLISNRHCTAIGSLSADEISELEKLINLTRHANLSAYGLSSVFFEHGVACGDGSQGGCGTYHMHLHSVPVGPDINLIKQVSNDLVFRCIHSLLELRDIITRGSAYVLYIDQFDKAFVSECAVIPSQYMRQVLASQLGVSAWDWREASVEDRLISTLSTLSNVIGSI